MQTEPPKPPPGTLEAALPFTPVADPTQELYPGHHAEVAARAEKARASGEAAAETLPGPLAGAFGVADPVKPPQANIRKFVHYDFALLKKLNSPLHRRLRELGKPEAERKEISFTDEEEAELIFVFTRPCLLVKEILEREGREQFRNIAVAEIFFNEAAPLPPPFDQVAVAEIVQNLARAYGTIVNYQAAKSESGSFPPPPAERRTASAGGSII